MLNTETGAFGVVDSVVFTSEPPRNSSPNDFFSPVPANAPKPPPPEKLVKPLALALLLPRPAKADCPNGDDPREEDAPNADLTSVVFELSAGLPKTEGAPKIGFVAGVGVAGDEGVPVSAGGVLVPPKTLVVGVLGGLKKGELDGVVEPKAPKPGVNFPNPSGDVVRPLNAPPPEVVGVFGSGVSVGVVVAGAL